MKNWIIAFILFAMPLTAEINIVVLSGSLRKDSWNTKLAKEAAFYAEKLGAKVIYLDLNHYPLPFFNEDIEISQGMPENAKTIRRMIVKAQGVIIASPNYNGSLPGVLKNMLDWISRTEDGKESREILKGKKIGIMSASEGSSGGSKGLSHLEDVLDNLKGSIVKTQLSVSRAKSKFDGKGGQLIDSSTRNTLIKEINEIVNQ